MSRLGLVVLIFLIPCPAVPAQANFEITPEVDGLLRTGLNSLYNFDLTEADKKFDELIRRFPEHPAGYVYKAEVIWWQALQDRTNVALKDSFDRYSAQAIEKGEAAVKKKQRDFYVLLYLAAAYGNKVRFQGYIKKAYWSAMRSGVRGHANIQEAQALRPENIDCLIGTGSYNYFAGALPAVIKPFAWMFGVKGDKDEGIRQLQVAAQKGEYGQTEAKTVLLLVYLNEERFDDYQKLLVQLIDQYPRNPVFYTWMASLFISQQKAGEGVQFFSNLIKRSDESAVARVDLSAASYEMARLRMKQKDWDAAVSSLARTIDAHPSDLKLLVRAHLLRGIALDLSGRHEQAIGSYKALLALPDFENSHEQAKRYLKRPYHGDF